MNFQNQSSRGNSQSRINTSQNTYENNYIYTKYSSLKERNQSPGIKQITSNIQSNVNMLRKTIKIPK